MQPGKELRTEIKRNLVKCEICEKTVESVRTFTCRRCRKSSFCLDHFDPEYKVCSGCAAEERIRLYNNLLRQERSLKSFLRLAQFLFIVAAISFAARRFLWEDIPQFMKTNVVFEYVFYWGATAIAGMVLCYLIIFSQRGRIKGVQNKIQDHKVYSKYSRL